MLKLADYRSRTKGLPDLLPYAALIAPGVILNKDGSFLAAWEMHGQDTASSTPEELAYVSAQFNNAVRLLGTGWMLHVDAIRSSHNAYPAPGKGHFPDPVTQLIDDERRAFFNPASGTGRCFSTSAVFSITYKPNFNAAKMAGKAQTGVASASAHAGTGTAHVSGRAARQRRPGGRHHSAPGQQASGCHFHRRPAAGVIPGHAGGTGRPASGVSLFQPFSVPGSV
jgi:type IV secretion system protein VirB4